MHWRSQYEADGVEYLRARVSGKSGEGYPVAKHETLCVLNRLHNRQKDIATLDFEKMLGRVDELLFHNARGMHPQATLELLSETDLHTLSKQMGTNVGVLKAHYSNLAAPMSADGLA